MDFSALAILSPEEQATAIAMILDGPALEPPPGVMSNFAHSGGDQDLGYAIVLLGSALSGLAVLLRLHSRVLMKNIRIEDLLLVAALGLFAGHQYVVYDLAISPGVKVHQWNIQMKDLPGILYHVHLGSIFYGLVIMLVKTAILLDWLKLFIAYGQRTALFWVSHAMIWSNILFYGIGTLVELFQCYPRERIWNPFVEGHCPINMDSHTLASGIINLLSDITILVLPQKYIWSLHISKSKKFAISMLFGIGIFACVSAAVRLYHIYRMLHSKDQLYTVSVAGLWAVAEMTAGFLIIGVPAAPKVLKSLPLSESVVTLIRQWVPGSSGEEKVNSRKGLPSWYKSAPPKKRRDQFEVSELNEDYLLSVSKIESMHTTDASTRI